MTAEHLPTPDDRICPNCGKPEVGTFTADDSFLYGVTNPVRLVTKDVLFFRCMACGLEFTGEDGEAKREQAVQAHLRTSNENSPSPPDTEGIAKVVVGAGWYLPWHAINDLQRQSVDQLIKRSKSAHFTNVKVRINGKWEESEADWIKHMVRLPDETLAECYCGRRYLTEKTQALPKDWPPPQSGRDCMGTD